MILYIFSSMTQDCDIMILSFKIVLTGNIQYVCVVMLCLSMKRE
jgi:hypothetical protein